jgi:peptidoglycan hydrolase-like protein with peptidoglycan-binding domain
MTPRQAQMTIAGFVVMAMGVGVNALFLQNKTPINPTLSDRAPVRAVGERSRKGQTPQTGHQTSHAADHLAAPAPEERIYRFGQTSPARAGGGNGGQDAEPEASAETSVETSAETVRAVQRELRQRGYGALPNDGIVRLPTRAAVMAFEFDNGLALTGRVNEALLARIVLGRSVGTDNSSAGKVRSVQAESVIRSVQQSLAALGYQVGPADGRLGEETVRAIREFEVDKGMVPKGRVSMEVVARLSEGR